MIEKVTGSGLFGMEGEEEFRWSGCDYCAARTGKRLGATVWKVKGFSDLQSAKEDKENYYEFYLCSNCLVAIYYGEAFPEEREEEEVAV